MNRHIRKPLMTLLHPSFVTYHDLTLWPESTCRTAQRAADVNVHQQTAGYSGKKKTETFGYFLHVACAAKPSTRLYVKLQLGAIYSAPLDRRWHQSSPDRQHLQPFQLASVVPSTVRLSRTWA
jgi:hypothetical protein